VATSSEHRYDPSGSPRDRLLRVGDRERDAVSEILRRAHVEGRLDNDEFQVRVERCLTAKTYADLDGLIADFPREGSDALPAARHPGWRPWPAPFMFLPLVVVAAVAFGSHVAWLAVPLVFFFVVRPLVWHSWRGGPPRGQWSRGPGRTGRVL
jgi:Domain of unknown function (DUF1707)